MQKYWVIFKNSIQTNLVYRFDMMASFFAESIGLTVLYYLWFSIYQQGNHLGNYDLRGLVVYFVLTRLLSLVMTYTDIGRMLRDEIKEGRVIDFLLKPLSYFWRTLAMTLGRVFLRIMFFSPVVIIVILSYRDLIKYSFLNITFFLLMMFCGVLIYFLFFFVVGILTFHFDDIAGLNYLAMLTLTVLSGRTIPLDLFPLGMQAIIGNLPFKYVLFVPVQIITGKMLVDDFLHEFLLAGLWIFMLSLLAQVIYAKGLKKYESYGI